jgi:hypothetical protein
MKPCLIIPLYQKILLSFIIVASNTVYSAAPPAIATYQFNNTLAADEVGAPSLTAIDPLSQSHFMTDDVLGKTRPVYEFIGNTLSIENAGFSFPSQGYLNNDDAFSIEMVFQFKEDQSTWESIFGLSNRQSDNAFYVHPNNSLQVYPDVSGQDTFIFGEYHHVTLTNDGAGRVVVYIDGLFQFDSTTERVNFSEYADVNPERLIHFFVDNTASGGQNEYANGRVALIRIYDEELTANDVAEVNITALEEPINTCTTPINNVCVASYNDGKIDLPCITIPDGNGGTIMLEVNMKLIPSSTGRLTFEVSGGGER